MDLDDLITRHQVGDVRMAMSPGGEHLTLTMHKVPLAVVDTGTLEASAPSSDVSDGEGSGFPWLLVVVAGGIGLAGVGAYLATRHHRARLATPDA